MNENFSSMNKLDMFKCYNNTLEEDITSITKEYDKKYVLAINNLSSLVSNFISKIKAYIISLSEAGSALKNQILYSQFLLAEMNKKKEKYSQLYDRIEMINETRKLFDNNLMTLNNDFNIFISGAKKEFKYIKNLRIENINKIQNLQNKVIYKSSSRGKIKKNKIEIEDYCSHDKINSYNKNGNVYNNFIQCSNIQKNNNFSAKQINYRKIHFNQSQEKIYPKELDNINSIFNKKKSSSMIKEKNSRNKINTFQNSFSSRNNSSIPIQQPEITKNKIFKNNKTADANSSELKLAYKVLEFIFVLNKLQLHKNNNNNNEIKMKIEPLKNNLMNLTNEVIKQNRINKKYNNKNIINNNFIYNNKEKINLNNNDNIFNDEEGDITNKIKYLYDKIDKLKSKNQDLELLIKIKNKENQKLNKIVHNQKMFESYQGNSNININNNSLEKINIKKYNNKNINNKINLNSNNDLALLLNKKIEDLNLSLESYKKEKNQLNKDLILKNKTINDLTIKINKLINKNKNIKLDIDQKNNIRLFFKGKKQKNGIDKKLSDYQDKYSKLEKEKLILEQELEKEKKKNEKMDTGEIIKLQNKISEYKIKLKNYKEQEAQVELNANDNANDIENDFDIINETSREEVYDDTESNNIIDNNDVIKQNKYLKQKIIQLQNKLKTINSNYYGFDYEKLINNFSKDIKDKDIQIDNLNNQINELKAKLENKNIIYRNNKNKKDINEYDYKMLVLKEKNNFFQNNFDSYDDQINNNEKDIEELKNNINKNIINNFSELKITKTQFNFIANHIKNIEIKYTPDKYEILCDKFFNKYQWFLLINKKDKETLINDYHKFIWAEKRELINIEKFNKYTSEIEEENKNIMKYISQLEEKDDIISKLSYKLNQIEKLNSLEDLNTVHNKTDKNETTITKEKYNNIISQLKNLENEIAILRKENVLLKTNNNSNIINENNINNKSGDFIKFEEKLKNGDIKVSEDVKEIINNHFNNKKEIIKDYSMENNYIQSSKEIEENKITEKNEEEEESSEKSSDSSNKIKNNNYIKDNGQNSGINIVRRQLERITKLYEELDKRLKKIKNAVKNIFSNLVIKEREKEINNLLEICGFTEDEISEMFLCRE